MLLIEQMLPLQLESLQEANHLRLVKKSSLRLAASSVRTVYQLDQAKQMQHLLPTDLKHRPQPFPNTVLHLSARKVRNNCYDCDSISHLCLSVTLFSTVAKQGVDDHNSRAGASVFSRHSRTHLVPAAAQANVDDTESKGQLRSTAHSLIETLQVQLERERQQKRKLLDHLQKIEELSQQSNRP